MKTYDSAYSGSMFERADGDYVRRDDPVSLADALLETIHKSRDSLNDALDWKVQLENELEAAKQRELELLAVIAELKDAFMLASGYLALDEIDEQDAETIRKFRYGAIEPSQALREHEAKVLEEAADYFNEKAHNENFITSLIVQTLHHLAEERRKK